MRSRRSSWVPAPSHLSGLSVLYVPTLVAVSPALTPRTSRKAAGARLNEVAAQRGHTGSDSSRCCVLRMRRIQVCASCEIESSLNTGKAPYEEGNKMFPDPRPVCVVTLWHPCAGLCSQGAPATQVPLQRLLESPAYADVALHRVWHDGEGQGSGRWYGSVGTCGRSLSWTGLIVH